MRAWGIVVEHRMDTESSILAFGLRDSQPVVLKVLKTRGDEWRSAEILDAFEGRGAVRVYDYVDGAMLLERLNPGQSLAGVALSGNDHEATAVLAEVIGKMSPRAPASAVPSVRDWAKGFARYAASGDTQFPKSLASEAYRVYSELTDSQSQMRLLHGDLHHYGTPLKRLTCSLIRRRFGRESTSWRAN